MGWIVSLITKPIMNDFRDGYFPRMFNYKKDAMELCNEVIKKGGRACIQKGNMKDIKLIQEEEKQKEEIVYDIHINATQLKLLQIGMEYVCADAYCTEEELTKEELEEANILKDMLQTKNLLPLPTVNGLCL